MSMQAQPNVKLKAAREARSWSQAQVVQYLEIGTSTYENWERGIRPSEKNINKLCHLFRKTRKEIGF